MRLLSTTFEQINWLKKVFTESHPLEKGLAFEDWRGTMVMVFFVFLAVVVNFIVHFVYG